MRVGCFFAHVVYVFRFARYSLARLDRLVSRQAIGTYIGNVGCKSFAGHRLLKTCICLYV